MWQVPAAPYFHTMPLQSRIFSSTAALYVRTDADYRAFLGSAKGDLEGIKRIIFGEKKTRASHPSQPPLSLDHLQTLAELLVQLPPNVEITTLNVSWKLESAVSDILKSSGGISTNESCLGLVIPLLASSHPPVNDTTGLSDEGTNSTFLALPANIFPQGMPGDVPQSVRSDIQLAEIIPIPLTAPIVGRIRDATAPEALRTLVIYICDHTALANLGHWMTRFGCHTEHLSLRWCNSAGMYSRRRKSQVGSRRRSFTHRGI